MSKINMRGIFLSAFLIFSNVANAAVGECVVWFETQPVANYMKKDIEIPSFILQGKNIKKHVAEAVESYTGKAFDGTTFDEAIEAVYRALDAKNMLPLNKAERMALFASDLNPVFEAMLKKAPIKGTKEAPDLIAWEARRQVMNKVKTAKYTIARKLNALEAFTKAEYKSVKKEDFIFTKPNANKLTHMKVKDYPKYVESYLKYLDDPSSDGAKLYGKIKGYNEVFSGSGILSISDIRDVTSYSLWPMYLKSHDIRHIHFALTHPMALASMMNVTRSKNHLRYVLLAGLYEGVDRVQYGHETALNKFFGTELSTKKLFGIKRNMDLEEAMLTLAILPKAELNKVAKLADVDIDDGWLFNGIKDWQPKKIQGGPQGHAIDGESFEEEINDMTQQFTQLLNRSEKIKQQLLENPSKKLSKEDKAFMKLMNYQMDPNDPEIVIEGLRFKNDGRAHFDTDDDLESAIGLGDN